MKYSNFLFLIIYLIFFTACEKKESSGVRIESSNINRIVCKIQTEQLSEEEIEDELEKFIEEIWCTLSLDSNDESNADRNVAEVYDFTYSVKFLDDNMKECNDRRAPYVRVSPIGKIQFPSFVIPNTGWTLQILWPE